MKQTLYLWLILWTCGAFAQNTHTLGEGEQCPAFAVLADDGYGLTRVATDTSLHFIEGAVLNKATVYWLRVVIKNPDKADRQYTLQVQPNLDHTLYYFDAINGRQVSDRAGILHHNKNREWGIHSLELPGGHRYVCYIKIDLRAVAGTHFNYVPEITLTPVSVTAAFEQRILIAWTVGLAVLLLFFLNNLYIYFSFRDKSVLYYLVAQLGGMLYLTAYWRFFWLFINCPVFSFALHHNQVSFYDLNRLFLHTGIGLVLYGYVQLTRSYLHTKQAFPRLDALLHYGLYGYLVLNLVNVLINVSGYNLEYYTLIPDNGYCLLLIVLVLVACVRGYVAKLPGAGTFLLANILPLAFLLGIPLFHLLVTLNTDVNLWLPLLAIVTQALGFSIALVARTRLMQQTLSEREIEAKQLAFDLQEAAYLRQLNELELSKMAADIKSAETVKTLLNERLETSQRELASSTLYMVQKNELLAQLKREIQYLNRTNRLVTSKGLQDIVLQLENNIQLNTDWTKFKIHFEQVQPTFFEELNKKHPNLTVKEVRLCAYFHLKLSHKEIAALLGIDPASVRRAKTRLLKKIGGGTLW